MRNFDRQYRFSAGPAGGKGFEIGIASPMALHISFALEKSEVQSPNTGKITLWNLSPQHLAVLNQKDCTVTLKVGYGNMMPLAFVGDVTNIVTEIEGADTMTQIEAVDGRVALRDSYITLSYAKKINSKTILEDIAGKIGVPILFSQTATFVDFPGYSFVGVAKDSLSKICATNKLVWTLQNGVLQVSRPNEPITMRAFLISPDTGLIGIPKTLTKGEKSSGNAAGNSSTNKAQVGYEIVYLMNAAIGVNDYIQLKSKDVSGNFRISKLRIDGDNIEGDWLCTAEVLELG